MTRDVIELAADPAHVGISPRPRLDRMIGHMRGDRGRLVLFGVAMLALCAATVLGIGSTR